MESICREAGRLDNVVANAGVLARGATRRGSSAATVNRLFDINIGGVLNTVRAAFLPSSSRGRLVLISSVSALVIGAGASLTR